MANPVEFEGQTNSRTDKRDGIKDLPTAETECPHGQISWSCWELTDEELMEVLQTKRIWLGCLNLQPAVIVAGEKPEEIDG